VTAAIKTPSFPTFTDCSAVEIKVIDQSAGQATLETITIDP